jgi:hypothetical protein
MHDPSANDNIRRLAWKSIESFEYAHSDMESLVGAFRTKAQMKSRVISGIASVAILLIFCYLAATFFTSEEDQPDPYTHAGASPVAPKFLHLPGVP